MKIIISSTTMTSYYTLYIFSRFLRMDKKRLGSRISFYHYYFLSNNATNNVLIFQRLTIKC